MTEEKDAVIACRVPHKLKEELQEVLKNGYWLNESDFVREAIRSHILGWTASREDSKPYLSNVGEKERDE